MPAETERDFIVRSVLSKVDVECTVFHFISVRSVIGRCGFVGVSAEQDFRFGCAENLKFERS